MISSPRRSITPSSSPIQRETREDGVPPGHYLVRPRGFDPLACGFVVRRSIQLSYGRMLHGSRHLRRDPDKILQELSSDSRVFLLDLPERRPQPLLIELPKVRIFPDPDVEHQRGQLNVALQAIGMFTHPGDLIAAEPSGPEKFHGPGQLNGLAVKVKHLETPLDIVEERIPPAILGEIDLKESPLGIPEANLSRGALDNLPASCLDQGLHSKTDPQVWLPQPEAFFDSRQLDSHLSCFVVGAVGASQDNQR